MVLILGVRELLWFPPKSANFSKIYDIYYLKGKYSKFFPWICNLVAVDNVTVNGGIVIGKNYRFI